MEMSKYTTADENKSHRLLSPSKVIKSMKVSLGTCTQLCLTSLKLRFQSIDGKRRFFVHS